MRRRRKEREACYAVMTNYNGVLCIMQSATLIKVDNQLTTQWLLCLRLLTIQHRFWACVCVCVQYRETFVGRKVWDLDMIILLYKKCFVPIPKNLVERENSPKCVHI